MIFNSRKTISVNSSMLNKLDRFETFYEAIVERLYAAGDNIATDSQDVERFVDALINAAQTHLGRPNGYRLAEKALIVACRIINRFSPDERIRLTRVYRLLGHVCCRQGKHREAIKYNALALLLQVYPQPQSLPRGH